MQDVGSRRSAVAALTALVACATAGAPGPFPAERMRASLDAGLDLYDAGDFVLAARRFREAAARADSLEAPELGRKATAGECVAWLRARQLDELAECSQRLERRQRRARRSDPGVNTLVALGAVAGGRPLPTLRVPGSVRPLIEESARERAR